MFEEPKGYRIIVNTLEAIGDDSRVYGVVEASKFFC